MTDDKKIERGYTTSPDIKTPYYGYWWRLIGGILSPFSSVNLIGGCVVVLIELQLCGYMFGTFFIAIICFGG